MEEPVRNAVQLDAGILSVLEAGPETGFPVVFIHGIPTGAELWRQTLKTVASAGFRVYAPDMPGYGQTRLHKGGDYSLSGAAECIASWMQVEDIAPAVMVAHDIGGGALQILATRHPELVDQMVFSNAIVGDSWPVAPVRFLIWIAKAGLMPFVGSSGLYRYEPYLNRALRRTFADPALAAKEEFRNRIVFDTKMTTPDGRLAFAEHLKSLANAETLAVEKELAALDMPAFLLWGRNDPYQPWDGPGRRLQRIFPRADMEFLDGAGHFLMLDRPHAYADCLIRWLNAENAEDGPETSC